jgi:hypothetical protein
VQWTRNLAQGDEVLASDDCIYLHLERENRVIGLGPQGQHQWHRPLAGQLTSLGQGALMATDAATARVITCDQGREQWIFAPDRVRNLRFLAVREDAIRLLGETGPQRTLYLLDLAGQPQGRLELPSQTTSARSTQGGAVLARTATHLQALDQSGTQQWSHEISSRTEIAQHRHWTVLADSQEENRIVIRLIDQAGRSEPRCLLEAGKETVALRVVSIGESLIAIAACAGPLSPCAEAAAAVGPFNRLWTCAIASGETTAFISDRDDLFFDLAPSDPGVVVVASPGHLRFTAAVHLSPQLEVTPWIRLPERRMLGPFRIAPDQWLVATCHGPDCLAPWQLHALPPPPLQ